MTIKPIITLPDPVLREVSRPVERIDDGLLRLLDDMLETMYDAPGIGLAGIQVGVPLRIVTIDVAKRVGEEANDEAAEGAQAGEAAPVNGSEEVRDPLFLINPKILSRSEDRSVYDEGCLSIPDYYAEVERPASCVVAYLDRDGKECIIEADGILSTCIQHEIDHLDGTLFIDHLSRLKRDMVIKKFTKLARQGSRATGAGHMVG